MHRSLCAALLSLLLLSPPAHAAGHASGPTITGITVTGSNLDLAVQIKGSDFGNPPKGVPCDACASVDMQVVAGTSACSVENISAWTDTVINVNGLQGNPGDTILLQVTNPQTKEAVTGRAIVPSTIKTKTVPVAKITSVTFGGEIGRALEMHIKGSGFGKMPPSLPMVGDLPQFAFVDHPFNGGTLATATWIAGYGGSGVALDYATWSDTAILIVGFGGAYANPGSNWTVSPKDNVLIAVTNSGVPCGVGMVAAGAANVPSGPAGIFTGQLP